MAQKITQELLPFWPGDHVALFEDIRPTDVQARLDEIRTAYPVLSINEIRERYYQLPQVEWGGLPVNMELQAAQNSDPDPQPDPTKAALVELQRWERYTLKRWGQPEQRPFEIHVLPEEIAFEVSAGLLAADDADEAQGVFQAVRKALQAT